MLADRKKNRRRSHRQAHRALRTALFQRSLRFESLEDRRLLAVIPGVNLTSGEQLYTYTLAMATTAEFTNAVGSKAATQTFLNQFVAELNKLFEREVALTFQLHADNDRLIFEDAATDGYANGSVSTMINENTPNINQALNGDANNSSSYDIGHVLGIGSDGGLAGTSSKASGASDLLSATINSGTVTLVAHEIGHQLNASHSFNGTSGSCAERSPTGAFEPGSGSTIMGYQGTCGVDDLSAETGDDTYFHASSFDEMAGYLASQTNRGTKTATGNDLPTVSAGPDYTIPASTPFTLTATASDSDAGDTLTYGWEQIDGGGSATEILQGQAFTVNGNPATPNNTLNELDQTATDYVAGDQVSITGTNPDGSSVSGMYTYQAGHTLATLIDGQFLDDGIRTTFHDQNNVLTIDVSLNADGKITVEDLQARSASLSLMLQNGGGSTGATTFGSFQLLVDGKDDPGGVHVPIANANDQVGPLFRSFVATGNPSRTFPRLSDILANTDPAQNKNEHLPTQARELNFRVTVRDNHTFNGKTVHGIRSDDTKLTVVNTGAPFKVTTWNATGQQITGGSTQTITWDVAGTTANGINTSKVDVSLSIDGGQTFPFTLLSGTDNDGTETIVFPNIDVQQARLKIQADPAQNVFFDINHADFEIDRDPSKPAVIVAHTGSNTLVGEGALQPAIDTYTVSLTTAPTAAVTITVAADAQTQVSVDGTNFATSQTVTFATGDNSAKTVTVKAVDDAVLEGVHQSTIRNTVTASTDPNYDPTKFVPELAAVAIADDEDTPLVAVDFDFGGVNPTEAPMNWVLQKDAFFTAQSYTDMTREDGLATAVDLGITVTGATQLTGPSGSLDTGTVPQHTPDIARVTGAFGWPGATGIDATWSGLATNTVYRIYTFLQGAQDADQKIWIKGSGIDDPSPFDQKPADFTQVAINDMVGSNSSNITTFGKTVTSKNDGTINVEIRPNAGATTLYMSGLAIQEIPQTPAGFTITQSGENTSVSEGATTDTFTVVLDARPTSNVVLNVSSGDVGEATVDQATLIFTPADYSTPQTVTVTGVDDTAVDGNQTTTITVSVDDAQSDNAFDPLPDKTVSVTTADDDQAGFTVAESGGSTGVSESGTTDTFTVILDAQPSSNVVFSVSSGDTGEATVDKPTLTFTSTDYSTPQTVTVTGVDDTAVDGSQSTTITVSVDDTQSDNAFDPLPDQSVSVTTMDDGYHGWQNQTNRLDVDGEGHVVAQDALTIINYINSHPDYSLPVPPESPPPYYDINNDGLCTPLDALLVINYINGQGSGEGEALQSSASSFLVESPLHPVHGITSSDPTRRVETTPALENGHVSACDERVVSIAAAARARDDEIVSDGDSTQQAVADAVWDDGAVDELNPVLVELDAVLARIVTEFV